MKKFRIVAILLVMCLASSCFVGSTFAKYSSTASGSDKAVVAKWSIGVGNTDIAKQPDISFNLFGTKVGGLGQNDLGETTDDLDVRDVRDVNGSDVKIIAPGTSGSFTLVVSNLSDVNATYTITLSETENNPIPIQYSLNGTQWVDAIVDLNSSLTNCESNYDSVHDHTVYWRWQYQNTDDGHLDHTDDTDKALGVKATLDTVTITASITITQND